MKLLGLAVALALVSACKSPGECDLATQACTNFYAVWPMPGGGGIPQPKPKPAPTVFYEYPGCTGAAYVADGQTPFAYQSVQTEATCENESGIGHGEII